MEYTTNTGENIEVVDSEYGLKVVHDEKLPTNLSVKIENSDHFFTLIPRNELYISGSRKGIPLTVIRDNGFEIEPDINFKEVTLSGNTKIFTNQSGNQDSFNISILIHTNQSIGRYDEISDSAGLNINDYDNNVPQESEYSLVYALDKWIRQGMPFYVYTKAVGINKNHLWLITKNKKRTQNYADGYSVWDLTFTRYRDVYIGNFKTASKGVADAIKKYTDKKDAKKEAKLKEKEKIKKALAKCKRELLKYSKKKKIVPCVKTLQERLWLAGSFSKDVKKSEAIDGWFGKTTKQAVINWQKKWGKTYGLNTKGYVDVKTYNALIGKGKKVKTSTKTTDKNLATGNVSGNTVTLVNNQNVNSTPKITVKAVNVANLKPSAPVVINMGKLQTVTTTKTNGTKVTTSKGKSTKVTSKSGNKNKNKNKK